MTAYTAAGVAASSAVGATLGWLGSVSLPPHVGGTGLTIVLALAAMAIVREVGWLTIPMPQRTRQTQDFWARVFPGPVAAALWGFDLGLVFTTWLTFSGVWLLVVVAILIGEPAFGAALFFLHWFGRALSAWLAPLLSPDGSATPDLMEEITGQYRLFQLVHVVGIVGLATVFILKFVQESWM